MLLKNLILYILNYYKQTLIDNIYNKIKELRVLKKWLKNGMISLPPHIFKQRVVKAYKKRFLIDILIETGTYFGDMIYATRKLFKKIYSIELNKTLYNIAKRRFANYGHISIFQGDSMDFLPKILSRVKKPCLFWLDAHYSGGITAKGKLETPIKQELKCILKYSHLNHVILIDDAHMFIGKNDYPTLKELKTFIYSNNHSKWAFTVKNDIIRIHKKLKVL